MNFQSKKGFALGFAICFIILAIVTSIAMYASIFYISTETTREVDNTRGYYVAAAALQYMVIQLRNSAFINGLVFNNHVAGPIDVNSDPAYANFKSNIGLTGNDKLTITITEYDPTNPPSDPDWQPGKYQVSAAFKS